MTDVITMLGEIIVSNMITLYWIFMLVLLIGGIIFLKAKEKLTGVVYLVAWVFLLILYRVYPISPQPYRVELFPVIVGVMFIVGICFYFGLIINVVMKKIFFYTRGRKKISEETPAEKPPSIVQPEPKVSPKVQHAAGRGVVETAGESLEERLDVLRAEIRRLIGYHTEDLKEEAGKVSEMIKDGYWVQAENALNNLEGKVIDRKTEKDRYNQFIDKVNEFVRNIQDSLWMILKHNYQKVTLLRLDRKSVV